MNTERERTALIIARKNRRISELVRTRKSQAVMIQGLNGEIERLKRENNLYRRANNR